MTLKVDLKAAFADQQLANLLNGVKAIVIAKVNLEAPANTTVGDKGHQDIGWEFYPAALIVKSNNIPRCALVKPLEFFRRNPERDNDVFHAGDPKKFACIINKNALAIQNMARVNLQKIAPEE